MKQDIRKGIKSSFLYKRFAYNSEGFVELMKFLKNENIIDDFLQKFENFFWKVFSHILGEQ